MSGEIDGDAAPGTERAVTLDQAMTLAVQFHQAGRFSEARDIYEAVLRAIPAHPDALHFLGVLHHQHGDETRAVELIRRAIELRPDYVDAHNNLGNVLKEAGDLAGAGAAYREVIRLAPSHAAAWSNLGASLKAQGRLDEALEAFARALENAPDMVDAMFNQGNTLVALDRLEEAERCYRRLLEVAPLHADAHFRLGKLLAAMGRSEEALAEHRRVVELDGEHADAHCNVGHVLQRKGLMADAMAAYERALALNPVLQEALEGKLRALYRQGQLAAAAAVARRWIEVAPDNPVPRHMLAAVSGEDVPSRASDDYVRRVFDEFAEHFDRQLGHLDYRAPEHIADALAAALGQRGGLEILDAGCGTGLCGPLLRPRARRLVGVDLSPGMLERAGGRAVYDELLEGELTDWLRRQAANRFDVVACADTLCYFGDLHAVVAAMARVLRADGVLALTVESADAQAPQAGYLIHPHGRYSHTRAHVADAVTRAGLRLLAVVERVLRKEGGVPVDGLIVTAATGAREAAV